MSRPEPAKAITAAVSLADAVDRLARDRTDPEMPLSAYVDVLARLRDAARSTASALRSERKMAAAVLDAAVITASRGDEKVALPEAAAGVRGQLGRAVIYYGAASEHLHSAWRDVRALVRRTGSDASTGWCRFASLAKAAADAADTLDDVLAGTSLRDGEDAGPLIGGHREITEALERGTGQFRFACEKVRGAIFVSGVLDPEARKSLASASEPAYSAALSLRDAKARIGDTRRVFAEAAKIRRILTGSDA